MRHTATTAVIMGGTMRAADTGAMTVAASEGTVEETGVGEGMAGAAGMGAEAADLTPTQLAIILLARGQQVQFRAVGRSMWPSLRPGVRVTIIPVTRLSGLRVGDIAFLACNGRPMIHRVVQVAPLFRTKGDALPAFDPPPDAVYGRVAGHGGTLGRLIARFSSATQPLHYRLTLLGLRLRALWRPRSGD